MTQAVSELGAYTATELQDYIQHTHGPAAMASAAAAAATAADAGQQNGAVVSAAAAASQAGQRPPSARSGAAGKRPRRAATTAADAEGVDAVKALLRHSALHEMLALLKTERLFVVRLSGRHVRTHELQSWTQWHQTGRGHVGCMALTVRR